MLQFSENVLHSLATLNIWVCLNELGLASEILNGIDFMTINEKTPIPSDE